MAREQIGIAAYRDRGIEIERRPARHGEIMLVPYRNSVT
jgi:hypothetical protein